MRHEYEVTTPSGRKFTLEMSEDYKDEHWPDAVLVEDTMTKQKAPTRNRARKPDSDK
ncbi:hypothetical protein [Corynebacterium phage LGCM-V6]|uniref:hypothetical protein n=1 Tax=Corynebacterium pseudotuberculosis TaxID=1719 RepID=UPI000655BEFC|nr:hypothetical protein [Corynebacterium pseudotuberculosis]AQY55156.1 hypothetical protein LGCMVI_0028 [Corynebacterium phage LGCM-VI]ARM68560.1 hypothetical protein [Corynebacterium phage LGCM-V2]ARM68608.1 hypothetical protein [Corynebacterium phage LGCM-V3]ARM68657.1 hypothetical protein [Corynebacterium phage LGCM-V4]ARM68705.1 hypothetical protein [Corynebacterium phage LGCM-V6]ARM68753.1 hypothetical protein [Corynebacterium phage LGCM-V5]ARM68801.1 hypothetical protein [Corynebacteri